MKKTLLIVEDDEILASALKEQFVDSGFEVKIAYDGEEALSVLKKLKPDIILLDLILPKINGFEVLEKIKSDVNLKQIPIIILSNLGQDRDIKRGMELGANDYFVKAQHPLLEIVEKVSSFLAIPQSPFGKRESVVLKKPEEKPVVQIPKQKEEPIVKEEVKEEIVVKPEKVSAPKVKEKKEAVLAPKGVKKFIRKQKEEIKKTIADPEERKRKIEELYEQYGQKE